MKKKLELEATSKVKDKLAEDQKKLEEENRKLLQQLEMTKKKQQDQIKRPPSGDAR